MKKIFLLTIIGILILVNILSVHAATSSQDVNLEFSAITASLVNQDPDPAAAGDVVEIRISVENRGSNPANNVIVEIEQSYPFSLLAGESATQNIGTIKSLQGDENAQIVKFRLKVDKDATAGSYDLKVWNYEQGSAAKTSKTLSIDVQSKESAEVIYIDQTVLIPGKQSTLTFTVNNVGKAPLRDLTFYWENEENIILPVGSDNTKYIKYIDVGESAELQYKVIADTNTDAGLYKLDLFLAYDDPLTSEEKQISTIAGIYVGGVTDFDVAVSESSGTDVSLSIANIGSNPAMSVSVIVPEQASWSVSGPNSAIIGNLNTGDYTVASFSIQQSFIPQRGTNQSMNFSNSGQRAASNPLKVQIAYTDTMGERHVIEKEVSLSSTSTSSQATTLSADASSGFPQGFGNRSRVSQQPSFFSRYGWYILGIIVLGAAVFLHQKYRKNKLLNPKYRFSDLFRKKQTKKMS